jgi:integrase
MYSQMLASGLSASSVLRTHRILSRALKVAMQRGKITRNVCTLVDPPTPKRPESSPLTVDEARRVLHAAQAVRNSARWTFALALGLRQSEALGLKWSDVDLDRGTLSVRRWLHRVAGQGLVFEEPKSARSRRTLALPARLVEGCVSNDRCKTGSVRPPAVSGRERTSSSPRPTGARSTAVPTGSTGEPSSPRQASSRSVCMTAPHGGDPAPTVGVHPRVVMELLGHSEMRTTTDVYSHVMPALAREAADRMGTALWGPDRN